MRAAARGLGALSTMTMLAGCAATIVAPPQQQQQQGMPATALIVVDNSAFQLAGAIEQGGVAMGFAPTGAEWLRLDGKPVGVATDGRFMIGFDRDQPPIATLEAARADGTILRRELVVAARAWPIESLPTLPRGTTPTPEFLARRKIELEQIAAARAIDSAVAGWRQRFVWPASGRISGVFGSQRIYAGEPGAFHTGVDIARPEGTEVVAPADGVVVLAAPAPFTLEGRLLMIDHGMGLNSAFLHLSRIDVAVGQTVSQGQPIGAIGMTGRATGPHLHWALKWRDARIDPARLAGAMPK